jgi:methyl-accepting chemotaxis protein
VNGGSPLPSGAVAFLQAYARGVLAAGAVAAVAAPLAAPPGGFGWLAAVVGALAVAGLRLWTVDLSKFSYLTMTVVPVAALTLLGEPAAAVLSAFGGTLLGDALRRKPPMAVGINAGREALAAGAGALTHAVVRHGLGLPPADLVEGTAPALSVDGLPLLAGYFVVYFATSRGLFYFSLLFRGKLMRSEWAVIVRYEFVSAVLGTLAALAVTGAVLFGAGDRGWAMTVAGLALIVGFILAAGILARELVVEAVNAEELRKVVAMEAVVNAGMPLAESLARIEQHASRLVDWSRLHIYQMQDGRLRLIHPAGAPQEAPAHGPLLEQAARSDEAVLVHDAARDTRTPVASGTRSLLLQPLRYGRHTLGILEIAHHRPREYGAAQVRLIERFGRQVSLALQLDSLVRPMTHSAHEMEAQLRTLGERLAEVRASGQGMAAHAAEIRQRLEEQGGITAEGLDATRSLAGSADEMAEDASGSAGASHETRRLAAENRGAIGGAIERLVELRDFVAEEARDMAELAGTSERIATVVDTIREIAEQVNLLALNAAIEAARAGEHGRGFAVVADEVRKLADTSGRSAEHVAEMMAALTGQMDGMLRRMERGAARLEGVGDLSRTALSSIDRIVAAAGETEDATTRIAVRSGDQRARIAAVRDHVAAIATIAERNGEGATRVADAARVQADALAEIERAAAALREVSERLTGYIERLEQVA